MFGVKQRIMLHRNKSQAAMLRRKNSKLRVYQALRPRPESKNPPPPCGSGGLSMGKETVCVNPY
jgi:hypothetical protein